VCAQTDTRIKESRSRSRSRERRREKEREGRDKDKRDVLRVRVRACEYVGLLSRDKESRRHADAGVSSRIESKDANDEGGEGSSWSWSWEESVYPG
jgi:hypothetical protein